MIKNKRLTTILIILIVSSVFAIVTVTINKISSTIDVTDCPPITECSPEAFIGAEITGAQVISLIEKLAKDDSNVSIMVTNQNTNAFYGYLSGEKTLKPVTLSSAMDKNSIYYIKPTDEYCFFDIIKEKSETYLEIQIK